MPGPPDMGFPVGITVPEVPITVPSQPEHEPDPSEPHPVPPREDLEQYAGEFIPDPWDDETQADWPNA